MENTGSAGIVRFGTGAVGALKCAVSTAITINAPSSKVWSILINNDHFCDWNPFIRELRGDLGVGNQLHVAVGDEQDDLLRFDVRITTLDHNRELRWSSRYFLPFLIDTTHYFILDQLNENTTTVSHGEDFCGILIPKMVRPGLEDAYSGFEAMNIALKARAEAQ